MIVKTEECYKCGGDGGEALEDGWMPCFRCATTGRLPLGTRAALCGSCDQSGQVRGEDYDDGTPHWIDCPECRAPRAEKKMSCGCVSHENGGPTDYPKKCRN